MCRKKVMCLLLVLITILMVSCGEKKETVSDDKKPTITYWAEFSGQAKFGAKTLAELPAYKKLMEETGVNIEYKHPVAGQVDEQLNLMLASGELPDIIEYPFFKYPGGPKKAIDDGFIITLNEVFEKYAPNITAYLDKNPQIAKMVRLDSGEYYTFPAIYDDESLLVFTGPIIRQDFLDEVKMERPETIDEWHDVLSAFKDKLGLTAPLSLSYNVLKQQSIEIEQYKMSFLKTNLDQYFVDAQNAAYSLSITHPQNFVLSNEISDRDYYNSRDISNAMKNIMSQNPMIQDIVMYYRDVDVVCSVYGLFQSRQFFDKEYNNLSCTYDEWIAKIGSREDFFDIQSVNENGDNSSTFFYCFDLSAKGIKNRNIIVLVEFNIEQIRYNIINKYKENNVVMLNNINKEAVYLSENKFEIIDIMGDVERSGGYVYLKTPSVNKKWSYVVRVEQTQYMKDLKNACFFAVLIFIGATLVVLIFSVAFSKMQYRPIKNLVTKINDYNIDTVSYRNEIDYIEGYLEYLNNSISEIEENDKFVYDMIYSKITEKIISGKADEKEWEIFLKYTPDFAGGFFTAAKITLTGKNEKHIDNSDFYNIVKSIISEYINKVFVENEYCGIVSQSDNELMCLVNTDKYMMPENSCHYFTMLSNVLNQCLGLECVIAVSDCTEGAENIARINTSVNELFRFMMLVDIKGVFHNSSLNNSANSSANTDFPLTKISNMLKCGKNAVEVYDEFDRAVRNGISCICSADELEWFLLKIKVMITKLVDEIVTDKSLSNGFLHNLIPTRSYAELKTVAKQIFNDLYIFLTENHNSQTVSGIEKAVKDFLDENYFDINLNIKQIAEHFNFHFVYLSHLFREKTGIGINDYITNVRMTRAKELLKNTDDTIENIVLKVGYVSLRTFNRNFKKHEGVSPSVYRNNYKKKQL